jgi:hypothetical protein
MGKYYAQFVASTSRWAMVVYRTSRNNIILGSARHAEQILRKRIKLGLTCSSSLVFYLSS